MPAPIHLLTEVIGRRPNGNINVADGSSVPSTAIAQAWAEELGVCDNPLDLAGQTLGNELERQIAQELRVDLQQRSPQRRWDVAHPGRALAEFDQYEHLGQLDSLIEADSTGALANVIGRDYEVAPDVTVGEIVDGMQRPLLHATVSCKATIRSDRAQNVRLEAFMLSRHRNGRLPHIVVVTAEPLPSRLASLCMGTGDIDAVYHLGLPQLKTAVESKGSDAQRQTLRQLIAQRRLHDYDQLADVLSR